MRIFSGIQPTGRKHLGNYIGAIRQYVAGQDRGEALYCIVDLHAITVAYEPGASCASSLYDTHGAAARRGPRSRALHPLPPERRRRAHRAVLAAVQRHRARATCSACTSSATSRVVQRELVSAGLLFYPVLQAADVLAYRADEVPVGEDQREHLELMRDVARRFNARFGDGRDVLVVPEHRIPEVGARIMDLQDPTRKMSTTGGSEEGTVYVLDEPAAIEKKLRRAVTDSGSEIRRAAEKPGISNLIEILAAVARECTPAEVEARHARRPRYGDLKAAVAEAVIAYARAGARALRAAARRRGRARARPRRTAPSARARSPRRRSPTCASAWASAPPGLGSRSPRGLRLVSRASREAATVRP